MRQDTDKGRRALAVPRLIAMTGADWLLLDRDGRLLGTVHAPRSSLVFGKSAPTFLLRDQPLEQAAVDQSAA